MPDNFNIEQGEELKKMIGAAVYIECSSKTQQVYSVSVHSLKSIVKINSIGVLQGIYVFDTECEDSV